MAASEALAGSAAKPKDIVGLQWVVDNFSSMSGSHIAGYLPNQASTESPSWSHGGLSWRLLLHARLFKTPPTPSFHSTAPTPPDVAITLKADTNNCIRVNGHALLTAVTQRKHTTKVSFDHSSSKTIQLCSTDTAQMNNRFGYAVVVRMQYHCQDSTPLVRLFHITPPPLCQLQDLGRIGMSKMYNEATFSDIEVCAASGEQFSCHRVVLAAASEPLSALFSNGMKESSADRVVLQEYSATTIEQMLRFIYGLVVNIKNLEELNLLWRIADQYMVLDLKKQCAPKLLAQLSAAPEPNLELACDMLANFTDPELKEVRDAVRLYILVRLDAAVATPSFLQLPEEAVQHLLSAAPIRAYTEGDMLDAMMQWVGVEEGRAGASERLGCQIRFDIMSNEELKAARRLPELQGSLVLQDKIACVYEQRLGC